MNQMHMCLASECTRNKAELLEREPCHFEGLLLALGMFGTAPARGHLPAVEQYFELAIPLASISNI